MTVLGQVCKDVTEALKKERERDCQKAVQEISNFLVQAWTHAQELPKSKQIRNAFSYIERKRKQKRHEI